MLSTVTARAGDTIRHTLDNPDTVPHTFHIPEICVRLAVVPQASAFYEFVVE